MRSYSFRLALLPTGLRFPRECSLSQKSDSLQGLAGGGVVCSLSSPLTKH